MPEDYIYRTTLEGILRNEFEITMLKTRHKIIGERVFWIHKSEDSAKIQQLGGDLVSLEQALGHNDIEMYIRLLKMELRCARTMADDQVNWLHQGSWDNLYGTSTT